MVRIRLLIDSVDQTAFLLQPPQGEWEIEQKAFGAIDSFKFTLLDRANTLSLVGTKEIIVENFGDATDRRFGGILTEINDSSVGLGVRYDCVALGWQFDLERTTVTGIFQSKSDQFIITDASGLFGTASEKDLSAYTVNTTNVKEIIQDTEKIRAEGNTLTSVIEVLTGMSNAVWGVTPKQVVYYRPLGESVHVFSLSDAPDDVTKFGYRGFGRFRDFSALINAVKVYGGRHREENQTKAYKGDGATLLYRLGLTWRRKDGATDDRLEVDKNTGTDGTPVWTAQTVGLPQETGSFDVVWDEIPATLEFTVAPPNFANNSFRVTGDIWRAVVGEALDPDSIALHGRFEVGIRDVTLTDDEAVERRADTELNRRSSEFERLVLRTSKDGMIAGNLITLVNATRSIDALYLIDKLITIGLGGTETEYEATLTKVTV